MDIPNTPSAAWAIPGLPRPERKPTAEEILTVVAAYYGISRKTLTLKTKRRDIVMPRQVASYLLCTYAGISTTEVGKIFSQDHTTVMSSRDFIADQLSLKHEEEFHTDIPAILLQLKTK